MYFRLICIIVFQSKRVKFGCVGELSMECLTDTVDRVSVSVGGVSDRHCRWGVGKVSAECQTDTVDGVSVK